MTSQLAQGILLVNNLYIFHYSIYLQNPIYNIDIGINLHAPILTLDESYSKLLNLQATMME